MEFPNTLCFLLLIAVAFQYTTAQTTDYCDPSLCYGYFGIHVACNATGEFASTCSSTARIVKITDDLRTLFIKTHNSYRHMVAGGLGSLQPAARMASMLWDTELAYLAEIRSRKCNPDHDKCRGTRNYLFAGQNIGGVYNNVADLDGFNVTNVVLNQIAQWFSQSSNTTMADINSYSDDPPQVGRFTAMIQEKANRIGCAILQHIKGGEARMVTTCNYGYINVVGRQVYTPGPVASQCTLGTHVNFANLCKVAEVYPVNEVPGHNGVTTKVIIN